MLDVDREPSAQPAAHQRAEKQRRPDADFARLGALAGLVLGSVSQVLLPRIGAPDVAPDPTWLDRAAALTCYVSGGASAMAALCWSVQSLRASRSGNRRWAATMAAVGGIVGMVLFGAYFLSCLVRALSGSYLTLGSVLFLLNGYPQLARGLVHAYPAYTLAWLSLSALCGVGTGIFLLRSVKKSSEASFQPERAMRSAAPPLAVVTVLLMALTSLRAGASDLGPSFALIASITQDLGDEPGATSDAPSTPDREGSAPPPRRSTPQPGPPMAAGAEWRRAAENWLPRDRRGPNVLLVVLESVGVKHLGYFGYSRDTTPNLDRIARRSVRFRRAWTTATHSNYSQMAILSSLFPRRRVGLDVYKRLDYPRVLLHDVFHQVGYATATISSQDETWQGMLRFQRTSTPTFYFHAQDHAGPFVDTGTEEVVPDHLTVAFATEWLAKQRAPWSLYVNLQATHFPYMLPPEAERPYRPTNPSGVFTYLRYAESNRQVAINCYDNALRYVDAQLGRLERFLEQTGQLDRTIWIITSDHGELFFEHDRVTHGRTLYDAEARVPLLVHFPERLSPGDVLDPVSNLDVLPTLVDAAGLPPHPAHQGGSLLGREALGGEKAVFMNIQGLRSAEAIVCWPWKLIVDRSADKTTLFNLATDPLELSDRSGARTEVASVLRETLRSFIRAQMRYHSHGNAARKGRFAPRLPECPRLPGGSAQSPQVLAGCPGGHGQCAPEESRQGGRELPQKLLEPDRLEPTPGHPKATPPSVHRAPSAAQSPAATL